MSEPVELSASEVRTQISRVISRVAYGGERIVIARHGNVRVAVVPMADLDRLRELDRAEAKSAVERMRESAARTGVSSMTSEEIEEEIAAARRERRRKRG